MFFRLPLVVVTVLSRVIVAAWRPSSLSPPCRRNGAICRRSSRHIALSAAVDGNNVPQNVQGSVHGQNACFLPLKQLEQDYYAPRIVQIAGFYPGLRWKDYQAVQSEPAAKLGQWTYDFYDADGPQLGTVALDGSATVANVQDPVAIIASHDALGVQLPAAIAEAVDLIVLVDRAMRTFAERKFVVYTNDNDTLHIAAFASKSDVPSGADIVGHIELVQVPWLPSMGATKTGFLEADEYF